jgi:hypothetical protein
MSAFGLFMPFWMIEFKNIIVSCDQYIATPVNREYPWGRHLSKKVVRTSDGFFICGEIGRGFGYPFFREAQSRRGVIQSALSRWPILPDKDKTLNAVNRRALRKPNKLYGC